MESFEETVAEPILYEFNKTTSFLVVTHCSEIRGRPVCVSGVCYSIQIPNAEIMRYNIPNIPKGLRIRKRELFTALLNDIDKEFNHYTIIDAAQFLGLSKCHFSRYFHKTMGQTFSKYLNYVKISKAVEIIKNNKEISIYEISAFCGFNNVRNFNRIFKALTGTTPKKVNSRQA